MIDQELPIIIGNWKMNALTIEAQTLAKQLKSSLSRTKIFCNVVLCPSYTALLDINKIISTSNIFLGAQDCSAHSDEKGSFTGDVSAAMLKDVGCNYVIIGHSERRQYHHESNDIVRRKVTNALNQRLIVILCVGETLAQRQEGNYLAMIEKQLLECLPENADGKNLIIAYEPVWAIGNKEAAQVELIKEVVEHISSMKLQQKIAKNIKLVYGGSVSGENALSLSKTSGISGFLVGASSLGIKNFLEIINIFNATAV